MSFLSRLFGAKPTDTRDADLDARLERLEAEADHAAPGYVGTSYNRAGDLARKEGRPEQAVVYYGRAIDAFLRDAQREAARGVANKIIRVRPNAVRTLCTLTWLDLSAGHSATALLHLREYVDAASEAGRRELAASQLYEMACTVPDTEIVVAVADGLDRLEYGDQATEVRAWVATEGSADAIRDPLELAEACLEAAVRSNEFGTLGEGEGGAGEPAEVDAGTSRPGARDRRTERQPDDRKRRYRWE